MTSTAPYPHALTAWASACFFPYQSAPYIKSGMLRYVLEKFETEPLPVQVVYAHSRLLSSKVRAFVDACVRTLRSVPFD